MSEFWDTDYMVKKKKIKIFGKKRKNPHGCDFLLLIIFCKIHYKIWQTILFDLQENFVENPLFSINQVPKYLGISRYIQWRKCAGGTQMVHKPGRMPLTASHRRDKLNFPGCSCQSLYGVCSSLLLTHLSYSCNNIELLNATKKN